MLAESVALFAAEQRQDAVLALREPLLLFESEHLLAHLRFPQLHQLIAGDDVLFLQQFFRGEKSGLIDEDGALVFLHRLRDRAERFRGALDDLFQAGHALQKMLVEGEIFFLLVVLDLRLFEGGDTGENEQLVLTAVTELAVVVVRGAAGLAEHVIRRLEHGDLPKFIPSESEGLPAA